MSKFRKKQKTSLPEISTASLPDIVFMLLFFFMVSTVMRNDTIMVANRLPFVDQKEKLAHRKLNLNIYVGKTNSRYGSIGKERIQLNDKFATLEDIKPFVLSELAARGKELRPYMTTSLRVDKEVRMGLVNDIKQELRAIDMLRINYATIDEDKAKKGRSSSNE